jgi:hypothetical protein
MQWLYNTVQDVKCGARHQIQLLSRKIQPGQGVRDPPARAYI